MPEADANVVQCITSEKKITISATLVPVFRSGQKTSLTIKWIFLAVAF